MKNFNNKDESGLFDVERQRQVKAALSPLTQLRKASSSILRFLAVVAIVAWTMSGHAGTRQNKEMPPPHPVGATYYVDTQDGDDSAGGGMATPWRSLVRVNQQVFAPGDAILFKAGCRWKGQLRPQGSGIEGHPIRIDRYGEGPLPVIDMGAATGAVIQLSNQEYWEIRHLELTSGAPTAREHRQGVLVLGAGAGRVFHHITVSDCYIHDLWGLLGGSGPVGSYTSTAILVASLAGKQVATFDEVLIERNLIERVDRSGIIVWTWTPAASATRVVVRHNRMENLGGDAILVLGSIGALVEYNVVHRSCLRTGDPNVVLPNAGDKEHYNPCSAAIWLHTCDRSIMQFNEVYDTGKQTGNQDGMAYDFDFNCRDCRLQYNYSEQNGGGFLLIMPTAQHNIVRFNISKNDRGAIMCGGSKLADNNLLHNNAFYVDKNTVEVYTGATYSNNMFCASGQGRFRLNTQQPGAVFTRNVYSGPWVGQRPDDAGGPAAAKVIDVPVFKENARILFQGDSITDGNRGRNDDPNHILGHGYCFLIAAQFGAQSPERKLTFINRGISGNRVTDLAARWQKDALDLKPDILSILIGINDSSKIPLDQYEQVYDKLLVDAKAANPNIRFILCEPFYLPKDGHKESDERDRDVKKRQAIVAKLAGKHHAALVKFQQVFDDACKRAPAPYWVWDSVHPTYSGHQLMADEWIKTVSQFYK